MENENLSAKRPGKEAVTIGTARGEEAAAISSVLAANRDDPGLFQESAVALARSLGDFLVARRETGEIVGCTGLHRDSTELAEVYGVAVAPQYQGQGIGQMLMQACLEKARSENISQLWLATVKPAYFARFGFQPVSRWELPAHVLLRKLRMTFHQPAKRWLPALLGKYAFLCRRVSSGTDEEARTI